MQETFFNLCGIFFGQAGWFTDQLKNPWCFFGSNGYRGFFCLLFFAWSERAAWSPYDLNGGNRQQSQLCFVAAGMCNTCHLKGRLSYRQKIHKACIYDIIHEMLCKLSTSSSVCFVGRGCWVRWTFSRTLLPAFRVRFTVVPLCGLCLGLGCVLVCWSVLPLPFTACTPFPLDFASHISHLVPPNLPPFPQTHWGKGQGLRDICMSEQAIERLTAEIRQLTIATQSLTQALRESQRLATAPAIAPAEASASAYPLPPAGETFQILLDERSKVPFPDQFQIHRSVLRFHGLEEGPEFLLTVARDRLTNKPPGIQARVEFAFKAGFWPKIALDTSTPYRPDRPLVYLKHRQWVVLRSSYNTAFRTVTKRDVERICQPEDPNLICEAFETVTEVEIYCFAAGLEIPALRSCTSPNWSSSAREKIATFVFCLSRWNS